MTSVIICDAFDIDESAGMAALCADTPIYDSLEPLPAWDGCGDDTCQSCHPE